MSYEWKDQVVLITGGATGIGAEVAKQVFEERVLHIAILDVDESAGLQLQHDLNSKNGEGKVMFYKCDVTNEAALFGVFKNVKMDQGYIDVVINNAGIMNDRLNTYKREIETNVTALICGTLKAIELMRKDKGGRGGTVINISSIAGIMQTPMLPVYFATKAAVLQFSNCIGMDEYYSRTEVRVLCICYGATRTSLLSPQKLGSFDPDFEENMIKMLDRFAYQTEESAAKGLLAAYRRGKSGSTWLVEANKYALDISCDIQKGFEIMSSRVTLKE